MLVFAAGASGNVAPVQWITGFSYADGVMTDKYNQIYVADFSNKSIKVFAPNASGPATPQRTIAGSDTGLNGPNYLSVK